MDASLSVACRDERVTGRSDHGSYGKLEAIRGNGPACRAAYPLLSTDFHPGSPLPLPAAPCAYTK